MYVKTARGGVIARSYDKSRVNAPPTLVAYAGLQERGAYLRDNAVLGSMSNSNSSNGIISISVAHAPTTTLKVVHSGANEPP